MKKQRTSDTWVAKAVAFDFDGTLTKQGSTGSTWEAIWEHLGYNANECGLLANRFYKKEISHSEWCRLTLEKFKARDLNYDGVISVARGLQLVQGFDECMEELQRLSIATYLVSGSIWDVIAAVLGDRIRYFRRIEANTFGYIGAEKRLGTITGTKFDFKGKGDFVRWVAKDLHVKTDKVLFVGNDINDIHVKAVGARTLLVNPHQTSGADESAWNHFLPHMNSLLEILPFVDSGWEKRREMAVLQEWQQAQLALKDMNELRLGTFSVLGNYRRFSNEDRSKLVGLADRIRRPLTEKSHTRENFLIYASPGSGKTFFIEELARTLGSGITFVPIDLSRDDREACEKKLAAVTQAALPCLCMIDEVDGRKGEDWPYDAIYKKLDLNEVLERPPVVFVLIGSSGGTVSKLGEIIRSRYKGKDLMDRVLKSDQHWAEIPPIGVGDTVCVYASKVLEAAEQESKPIKDVQKFAAYYVVLTGRTTRQIKLLADQAVRRVPKGHTQVLYDNHFEDGDKSNRAFLDQHSEVAAAFGSQTFRISE
ncbi:MAG TPA: HAD family hydrolase [Candidatus Angelobacter sp.]